MTFSKHCRRTVGACLRPDRPFLVTSLYTFFFGGGVGLVSLFLRLKHDLFKASVCSLF